MGITLENSIRTLAQKVNERLEGKQLDENNNGKTQGLSEFDSYLKEGAPSQKEQSDFSKKAQKEMQKEDFPQKQENILEDK